MSTILIVAKLKEGTGNKTTAERLRSYFSSCKQCASVLMFDIANFNDKETFQKHVAQHHVKVIVGIHAVRAGRLIQGVDVPYILVFGGTDVQCDVWGVEEHRIMEDVVRGANYLVAFTNAMKERALSKWCFLKESDVTEQVQGVITNPGCYTYKELFQEYQVKPSDDDNDDGNFTNKNIFLFVGGIRRVKDPMFLMDVVSEWHKIDRSILLVIIGPELDAAYTSICRQKVRSLKGVYMFPGISFCKVHALMKTSTALVNSSINEGMAGAILEAMHLGIPVIARRNAGNSSLITDGETGLLFESADEFKQKAMNLLEKPSLRNSLAQSGQKYVNKNHNSVKEKEIYNDMISSLLSTKKIDD